MALKICLFSSDFRPQYKKDIYNAMCLPDGFVIQFRYRKPHISTALATNISKLKDKEGIIFFSNYKLTNTGAFEHVNENISIREVVIKKVIFHNSTGLYHFYLELKEFKAFTIDPLSDAACIPPKCLVSELNIQQTEGENFYERIEKLKNYFPDQLFTKVDIVDPKCGNIIYPVFEEADGNSIYDLSDETEYSFKIDFVHTSDILNSCIENIPVLVIEDKSDQIVINSDSYIDIGTNLDNRYFKIVTKSMSSYKNSSFLNFKIYQREVESGKMENILQQFSLPIRIKKKLSSIFLFGCFSTIALCSLASLALFQASLKDSVNYWYVVASIFLAFISSSFLFNMFNKK